MTKSQLERVCSKIKCPQGTKKQMIINLLRPFTMNKYRMKRDRDERNRDDWLSYRDDEDYDNDLNIYLRYYNKNPAKFTRKANEFIENISEEERRKIKRLFKEHKEQKNTLMKENGMWNDYWSYTDGDNQSFKVDNYVPCCTKCEPIRTLWDPISFLDVGPDKCVPCKELPKYGGYKIDDEKKPYPVECFPPKV